MPRGISVSSKGSFAKTEAFLQRMKRREQYQGLGEKYGPLGVNALKAATPKESGDTAEAWSYEVVNKPGYFAIRWVNSHLDGDRDTPVAVLLQYGHATGNGGFVQGVDYINPALKPIFDQIAADMWKEVTR